MKPDLQQELYWIADEMRGMATIGDHFANNPYEVERAHNIMRLAAKIAALADDEYTEAEMIALFDKRPWTRVSPVIGVDAAVFNPAGEILLIKRRDDQTWAMPGGIAEIGTSLPETALKELWEEVGLRGRVVRQLGTFDGRFWGSRSPVHLINMVFQVESDDLTPHIGVEALDAGFFAQDALPTPMSPNHIGRVPEVFKALAMGCYFDPAESDASTLPNHQRPD